MPLVTKKLSIAVMVALAVSMTTPLVAAPVSAATSTAEPAVDTERAQVAAATANAFARLRGDIEQSFITPNYRVIDFLKQTDSQETFNKSLHRAEQIGGPRWIDEQTCQVRLEIPGERVAKAIVDIAAYDYRRTPIPVGEIDARLRSWKNRTFAATGTSIRADAVTNIRPVGIDAWRGVDDSSRVAAIEAARENSVRRALDEVSSVRLNGVTVGEVLKSNSAVSKSTTDWLRQRPVTSLQFQDDLQVQYTLAVSRPQLFDQFIAAAKGAGVKVPGDEALAKLRNQLSVEIINASGLATVSAPRRTNEPKHDEVSNLIPAEPPEWIFQQIDAEATAPRHNSQYNSQLRTQRDAEDRATELLLIKISAMELKPGLTVGQASKQSEAVGAAVARAVGRSRLYKVDFDSATGSVTVKMMMDPREFWYDLNRP